MPGRVEEVDRIAPIGKLKDRRADRDPPLLLQSHPVGRRPAAAGPGLDRSSLLDGTRVEQELLGQGGLACVGVADDRERPPQSGVLGGARCVDDLGGRCGCAHGVEVSSVGGRDKHPTGAPDCRDVPGLADRPRPCGSPGDSLSQVRAVGPH